METQFTQGATVYDGQGREYLYDAAVTVSDGGVAHVVTPLLAENADGDPAFGDAIVLAEVFAAPPVSRMNAQIESAQKRLAELNAQLAEVNEKLRTLKENERTSLELATRLGLQVGVLNDVFDMLQRRVTHFVNRHTGEVVNVTRCDNAQIDFRSDDYGRTVTASVSARAGAGDRAYGIICRSDDDVKAALAGLLDDPKLSADNWNTRHLIANAKKHGVPIPPALAEKVAAYERAQNAAATEKARAELAAAERRLAALATTPA